MSAGRAARRATLVALLCAACHAQEPPRRPLDVCAMRCERRARCSAQECARGCELILDRIVERESDVVLACLASHPARCRDVAWADCAVRVGAHADGGPPGPPPPSDEYED